VPIQPKFKIAGLLHGLKPKIESIEMKVSMALRARTIRVAIKHSTESAIAPRLLYSSLVITSIS
jgi:hypothetical protein